MEHLTKDTQLCCPHGGLVAANSKSWLLAPEDQYAVAGCPFPSPCKKVKWATSARGEGRNVLDRYSVGLCQNARGATQGLVIVQSM